WRRAAERIHGRRRNARPSGSRTAPPSSQAQAAAWAAATRSPLRPAGRGWSSTTWAAPATAKAALRRRSSVSP
ncbi:MAG: Oxidoreductase, short chain dehydrogenase/reductase family, partial [uncultured Acetobacteraceae bacterium]